MHRKKNERQRSKKSSPAAAPLLPHELPIPPSPPAFMLDDLDVPIVEDQGDGFRLASGSPKEPLRAVTPPPIELAREVKEEDDSIQSGDFVPSEPEYRVPVESAHSVAPVIHSEPSMMENLARAVRSIYPPMPSNGTITSSDGGSKRRPLSIGSLIGNGFSRRRASAGSLISTSLSPLLTPLNVGASRSHKLPETTLEEDDHIIDPSVPEVDEDAILFTSWFDLDHARHYLFLGYESGFQIWNLSSFASIEEVVNMKDTAPFNVPVFCAALIEKPSLGLIAILLLGLKGTPDTELIAYSLTSHSVLHRIPIPWAIHLQANSDILVVSSLKPALLHLISTHSFKEIHSIANVASNVTFSLSSRLLAFACPPPQEQEKHLYSNPGVISRSPPQSITPISGAIKVGQGIFSGMKTLSGLAMAAAAVSTRGSDTDSDGSTLNQWFSRSAPAASSLSVAQASSASPRRRDSMARSPPLRPILDTQSPGITHEGTWITIVDFKTMTEVHRFRVNGNKPVTRLHWTACGTILMSATSDGQTVSVYSVRPDADSLHAPLPASPKQLHSPRMKPIGSAGARGSGPRNKSGETGHPWHLYDLHRGHTSAKVLEIATSEDCRWAAAGTHRGTVHVFATNPYGGPTDIPSHMQARVINADAMQPLSTSLVPLIRVRPTTAVPISDDDNPTPMAIRFLTAEESSELPEAIAPPYSRGFHHAQEEGDNSYQDILVLHPTLGILELFRVTLDVIEPQVPPTKSPALRPRYIRPGDSPPRVNLAEPVSSVSSPGIPGSSISGLSRMMDRGQGKSLHGKESSVATWNLKRASDWDEVKNPLHRGIMDKSRVTSASKGPASWLAQVEITTFSRSPKVLAPSIYLSHQFSFQAFQEEYDALLRSHRFAVPTVPITVRKEVEAKGESDTFGNYQSAVGRPITGASKRPFDEPMASALTESLDYTQSSPPTFPMLPNGSLRPTSFLDTLPTHIRRSKDLALGVGEGLGKLRGIVAGGGGVASRRVSEPEHHQDLEDEELLDNVLTDADGDSLSRSHSGVSGSIHTPDDGSEGASRTRMSGTGIWNEWGDEEREVLEDAERFDEIYPAGVMDSDEEATPPQQAPRRVVKGSHKGAKKGTG